VADEWVTQMLRQSDAQVFKKYSQMKLQMKREALTKLNRQANEVAPVEARDLIALPLCTVALQYLHSCTVRAQSGLKSGIEPEIIRLSALRSEKKLVDVRGIEPLTPCLQSPRVDRNRYVAYRNYQSLQRFGESAFAQKLT
jgi:hypothetical protein